MATVYRALDTRLGRTVAIKILAPEYARDHPFVERFQQEAEFAASLGAHPNIVAIYDVGEDDTLRYIVMELIEGRNLKELIRGRAPFPVSEAFSIGGQVASALDFAHQRGLVHRDVKPQNIVVTPGGVAKVTDFGIARSVAASQMTRTGMVIGTVHYFSPEQAQGKPAGPASDIYSLGIILYEMLTGHLPFDAENAIGVAMQHIHSEPPPPWDYNPQLPARAVATVMRALEKDPARRYRDAGELASALAAPDLAGATGGTTTINPIVEPARQATTIFQPIDAPEETQRIVSRETHIVPPRRPVPQAATITGASPPWRTLGLALGTLLLVAAIAGLAFLLTSRVLGTSAGSATATPTPTATPKPKPTARPKRHHPTATAAIPIVVAPTSTFVPIVPTSTSVPLPTWTPVPKPKPKPTPRPQPTVPPPSPTPQKLIPTIEPIGPTATSTPFG